MKVSEVRVYCWHDLLCSLGGSLAKVSGFNQNRGLGWLLQEALAERQTKPTDGIVHAATADLQQVWIGTLFFSYFQLCALFCWVQFKRVSVCSEKPICAPPCLSEVFPASPNVCSSLEKYSSELNLTEGKGIVGYRHTQFTLSLSCTISRYVQVKFLLRMNIYIYTPHKQF